MELQKEVHMDQVVSEPDLVEQDEEEIRSLSAAWAKAFEEKVIDRLKAGAASSMSLFDVKSPFRTKGAQAHLSYFPARLKSKRRNIRVTRWADVAFAHFLHDIDPTGGGSRAIDTRLRITLFFRRISGQWRIVHDHVSVPLEPKTGESSYIRHRISGL